MGQYYRAVVGDHVYDTAYITKKGANFVGAKLTEHAYLPNKFVNAVANQIYHNPQRVAWVGDYADANSNVFVLMNLPYGKVWGNESLVEKLRYVRFSSRKRILVNHSRKLYVDMQHLYCMKDGYTFHPLPLLTALGNGSGGGDYWGTDMDKVGSWAGDVLSIEDEIPDDCDEYPVHFDETTWR